MNSGLPSSARGTDCQRSLRAAWLLLALGLGWWWVSVESHADEAGSVLVLYSRQSVESKEVADYYVSKRNIPTNQVIGLDVPLGDNISRPDYERLFQEELIRQLRDRGLMVFATDISPSKPGRPGRVLYRALYSKVRYIAICWGLPYRIYHDPNYDPNHLEEVFKMLPAHLQRNEGSVDGELALLPLAGRTTAWGPVRNPMYTTTNLSVIHPTNGVFAVTRIDAPTSKMAKALIDKSLAAERDGLNGRAYVDMRGLTAGSYVTGDLWLTNVATVARRHGYETVVDISPDTMSVAQPFAQVAVYAGWYAAGIDGPFKLPVVEFMPGAIAYHLHSFSAFALRSQEANWVGPLITKGATVTLGCIEEPYLELTPNIGLFVERLADQRANVGEAAMACQPVLSWQTVVIGDPLYRPFGRTFAELESDHRAEKNPALEWDLWRKANRQLLERRDPSEVLQELVAQPLSGKSALLSERIATVYAGLSQPQQAIEWGQRSLKRGGSPQQRGALMRRVAGWQKKVDPKGAMATLEQFAREFPGHPEILVVLQEEFELAQSLKRTTEAARIKSMIETLTPRSTNSPGSTPPAK